MRPTLPRWSIVTWRRDAHDAHDAHDARVAPLPPLDGRRSVARMTPNDGLRRYLEAGLALTQITRARAEELVHELIQAGEVETTPRPGLGRGSRESEP